MAGQGACLRRLPVFIERDMPAQASDRPALGDLIWPLLGLTSIAFHLWLVFSGLVPNLVSRPIHLMLAVPWILMAPGR